MGGREWGVLGCGAVRWGRECIRGWGCLALVRVSSTYGRTPDCGIKVALQVYVLVFSILLSRC